MMARSAPRSAGPSSTPWRSRMPSPRGASRATSIAPPPSERASWSDELAPRRRHRDGPGHAARARCPEHLGGHGRRPVRREHDRRLRSVPAERPVRGPGARFRSERGDRPQGPAPDGPLHAVRARRRTRGDGSGRPARTARGRAVRADRGDPRDRARRRRNAGGGLRDRHHPGPGPHQPVPHRLWDPERGLGAGRHQLRDDRPELRHGLRVRDGRPRDRRGLGDDPPRRRRRDARGRVGGRHLRDARRRVRGDARAVHPQRRSRGRVAPVRRRPGWVRDR